MGESQLMDSSQAIHEIEELFGREWLDRCMISMHELPLEERIDYIRHRSVSNKTFFFRDKLMLKALKYVAIPKYMNKEISIASVGCSTGEEIYSIILDNWENKGIFPIQGYDINPSVLEDAKKAEYPYESKTDEVLDHDPDGRTFTKEIQERSILGKCFYKIAMKAEARKKADFRQHDITLSPLPESYDIIILSSVLCHYTDQGREKIVRNVLDSMKKRGFLLCESHHISEKVGGKDYIRFMERLPGFGFKEQKVIVPTELYDEFDFTGSARIYRRK